MAGQLPAVVAAAGDSGGRDCARDEGFALSKSEILKEKIENQQLLIRHLKADNEKLSMRLTGLPVIYKIIHDLQSENKLLKEDCARCHNALAICNARLQTLGEDSAAWSIEEAELLAAALPPRYLFDGLLQENMQLRQQLNQHASHPANRLVELINREASNNSLLERQKAEIERLSGELRQLEAVLSGSPDDHVSELGRLNAEISRLREQLLSAEAECDVLRASCTAAPAQQQQQQQQEAAAAAAAAAADRLRSAAEHDERVAELEKRLDEQQRAHKATTAEKQQLATELGEAKNDISALKFQITVFKEDYEAEQQRRAIVSASASALATAAASRPAQGPVGQLLRGGQSCVPLAAAGHHERAAAPSDWQQLQQLQQRQPPPPRRAAAGDSGLYSLPVASPGSQAMVGASFCGAAPAAAAAAPAAAGAVPAAATQSARSSPQPGRLVDQLLPTAAVDRAAAAAANQLQRSPPSRPLATTSSSVAGPAAAAVQVASPSATSASGLARRAFIQGAHALPESLASGAAARQQPPLPSYAVCHRCNARIGSQRELLEHCDSCSALLQ